jgi:sulfatase modifying factor 1
MLRCLIWISALLAALAVDALAVTIDTVPVGNAGNGQDPNSINGYGAVDYAYRMGTAEVTVGQYATFLNAVAATDTFELYNPIMGSNPNVAGIARSGSPGSYVYSVLDSPNKPIAAVAFTSAMRFTNWLHNGQPTGTQNSSTTENGSYALNGATINSFATIERNPAATWVIPTSDEWHKAAYHKNDGVTDHYWNYPYASNAPPDSDQPPGTDAPDAANTANYNRNDLSPDPYNDGYAVTGSTVFDSGQNYLTDAGAYANSKGPYGTYDQAGNLSEWVADDSRTALFGGSWATTSFLSFRSRDESSVDFDWSHKGFRLALVPEPSTFVLTALGLIGLAVQQWRKR